MKNKKKHTILLGEGIHQHTLYGNFLIGEETDFMELKVNQISLLKHEKPNGKSSNEHKTLEIENGDYVMGKQVEFNPFSQEITRIFD